MKYDENDHKDLRHELRIDRNALDEEAICQPNNYYHASEGHVQALSRRDRKKYDLEVITSELDAEVRANWPQRAEKMTEAQVKARIVTDPRYQEVHDSYCAAGLEADRWEALRNAYRQRADMLKSLVQLHQAGYFGEVTGAAERRDARARFDNRRGA